MQAVQDRSGFQEGASVLGQRVRPLPKYPLAHCTRSSVPGREPEDLGQAGCEHDERP